MALPPDRMAAVEKAIHDLLVALGEDPNRDGLKATPHRVAKMYSDVLDGNYITMKDMTSFEEEVNGQPIIVHGVPFYAFCEHHLAAFQGTVAIAYIPNERVLGLSKLVRIFRHHCKRPTIQERITELAVNSVMEIAKAKGAICLVQAEHTCMTLRGIKSPGSMTTTLAYKGLYEEHSELRDQFLKLATNGH